MIYTNNRPANEPFCYCQDPSDRRRVIIVRRGDVGYWPFRVKATEAEAEAYCKHMNDWIGMDAGTVEAFQIGSMFGWDVPGAAKARAYVQPAREG
jgi:hypothetical protein